MVKLSPLLLASGLSVGVQANCSVKHQPTVNLEYGIYQATESSTETNSTYYSFPNIRYASPPVGDLRWKAPLPPHQNRSVIPANSQSIECPQGSSTWQIRTSSHIDDYLTSGTVPNVSYTELSPMVSYSVEDCLFLDVYTPRKALDNVHSNRTLSPVLVWIHGGGFVSGSKTSFGAPEGLLKRSQKGGSDGVVYVAFNYRLGALGFLSGGSFQEEEGVLNAGLLDQQLALQWIQDHIHRFGGDRNRVTVFGESGGGGSIMHHLTAYGGSVPAPFNQAIPQSPAFFPYLSEKKQESRFKRFLHSVNVTSLAEARSLSSDVLIAANSDLIGSAQPYTSEVFGPMLDGQLIQDDPRAHFSRGEFDQTVEVITSYNSDEGLLLTPAVHTDEEYISLMQRLVNKANASTISYIADTLYPPVFDGSMGYVNHFQRAAKTLGEVVIDCNAVSMGSAYPSSSSYRFDVSPATHAQDIGYTFYNPAGKASSYSLIDTGKVNQTIAYVMQDYILSFAKKGKAESTLGSVRSMPNYGTHGLAVHLESGGIRVAHDPANKKRCEWWATLQYN